MSAGFRSRWLGWTPGSSEITPTPPPTKPTKEAIVGFVGARPARILKTAAPLCPSCGAPVDDSGDVICGSCYAARRGPGEVLAFDPDRRSRTLARLADRPCPDCQAVTWHVNGRGDATCQTCARRRAGFDEMSAREARP